MQLACWPFWTLTHPLSDITAKVSFLILYHGNKLNSYLLEPLLYIRPYANPQSLHSPFYKLGLWAQKFLHA